MNIKKQLIACLLVTASALSFNAANAMPIDLQLVIQPIQVCNNDGSNCSNSGLELFEAVGDKIWSQAGIDLHFLSFQTLNSTALNTLNMDTEFGGAAPGNVIRLLFVDTITDCGGPGGGIFGCGYIDANGLAVADNVFAFNGGIGRLDTIAHELGHNLGLGHNNFGAGGALNLMTSGAVRTIPGSINDVTPDGAGTDQLTAQQIAEARSSSLLQRFVAVPIPGTLVLFAIGLMGLATQHMRRVNSAR